jgi:DNA polymerase elongation subunit (family B)
MGEFAKKLAPKIVPAAREQVRILTLDIENAPNLAHVWSLFNQNVSLAQLQEVATVISVAAKWYGEKEVLFYSDHHDGHAEMIRAIHALVSEADLIVGYNSAGFDMKHLNREFILAGLNPPAPYKNVDLLQTVRKQFKFASGKLDHVAQQLGLGKKTSHAGHDLWVRCMRGEDAAWDLMRRYNKQDVVLTEKLYDRLRAWIPNHPHLSMFTGSEWGCPVCGNKDISKFREGTAFTNVQRYRLYQCPCGHWIRGNKKLQDATQTRSAR